MDLKRDVDMDNDYNSYMKGNYFSIFSIHVLDSFLESEIRWKKKTEIFLTKILKERYPKSAMKQEFQTQ